MPVAWTCEDEDEAVGVELLLERAGVAVAVEPEDGTLGRWIVRGTELELERAAALQARIARHFVRHDERALRQSLDARDRLMRHTLYGCVIAVAWVLLAFAM